MIELNIKEYRYKDICLELGWSYQTGNNETKQKQIKCIEESFEFYHPVDSKTGKVKSSYIFTKQLKEPILEDGRKINGGVRKNAGRQATFSDEEFDYLWKVMVSKEYRKNLYHERSWRNKIYFGTFSLFEQFGFDYFTKMDGINFVKEDTVVKKIFVETVFYALKSNTITKLCQRYGYSKNKLPKGILRSRSKQRLNILIDDDELLPQYDAWEKEELEEMKCSSFIDAVRKNNLSQLQANVQKRFETVNKYNVQKKNMIWVNDFSVIDNGIRYGNSKTTEQYRKHFCQVVLDSVEKSCMNRIRGTKKYSQMLSDYQKQILKYYLDQLLGKEAICPEEPVDNYNWLDLIR